MHGYGMWGMMSWMWVLGPLSLILLALLILWIARESQGTGSSSESAEEILKKRYARGEIDNDEYEVRLRHIRGH